MTISLVLFDTVTDQNQHVLRVDKRSVILLHYGLQQVTSHESQFNGVLLPAVGGKDFFFNLIKSQKISI